MKPSNFEVLVQIITHSHRTPTLSVQIATQRTLSVQFSYSREFKGPMEGPFQIPFRSTQILKKFNENKKKKRSRKWIQWRLFIPYLDSRDWGEGLRPFLSAFFHSGKSLYPPISPSSFLNSWLCEIIRLFAFHVFNDCGNSLAGLHYLLLFIYFELLSNSSKSYKDSVCSTEGRPSGSKQSNPTKGHTTHGTPPNRKTKSISDFGKQRWQVESLLGLDFFGLVLH